MDTGSYMENQMSDLIEDGERMYDAFNDWLYKSIELFCKDSKREPHDVYPSINLTDAKLSFLDGDEYYKIG